MEDILSILVSNVKKHGAPFKINHKDLNKWAFERNIPRGGETILYTGLLYQLIPYIKASSKHLRSIGRRMGTLARITSKVIDLSKLIRVDKKDIAVINQILGNIVTVLMRLDIKFGYLYEEEPYSGVLLYDLGLIDAFKEHSEKVLGVFKKHGIKKIITIDPHTTHVMKNVYPMIMDEFNMEVVNYLELIANSWIGNVASDEKEYVIHDPCIYARSVGIIDEPRILLKRMGYRFRDISLSKKATYCCGGPLESVYPKLSTELAKKRLGQLIASSKDIITLCPICYLNLTEALNEEKVKDVRILDLPLLIG